MAKYKRVPMKSIEEFKWHTRIIKTFGKKALILYTAFPRTGAAVDEEQLNSLIEDEQSRKSILDFMLENGLIEVAGEAEAIAPKAPPKKEEIAPEEEEEKPKARLPLRRPKAEEEGNIEIVPAYEEEKPEEIAPSAPEKEEEKPRTRYLPQKKPKPEEEEEKPEEAEQEIAPEEAEEKKEEEIAPEEEEKPRTRYLPQKKPKPEEEEEKPEEAEQEIAPEEAEEKKEEEIAPEVEAEEAKEEIQPEEGMEAAPKAEEAEEPKEEAAPEEEEEKPKEEVAPEEEEVKITSEHEEGGEEEEEKGPNLTPAEMIVHDKYGEEGVLIFRLIDGKRSVAEVAKESGTSQDKVMEVLKYLDEVGLISLGGAGAEKEAKGGAAAETQEEKFAPLSEETETSPITIDEQKEGIRFAKLKPGAQFISRMKVKMSVVFKFGKFGREILEYLDSRKEANAIHLVIRLNVPINAVEAILAYLKSEGLIELSFMQRDDIRKEFGYDAYIMYKRYGKKGVIFYEVIDKEIPLKKIAELISEKDPAKIIEIFKLIRDVLGIDLPINEDAIKKELFA